MISDTAHSAKNVGETKKDQKKAIFINFSHPPPHGITPFVIILEEWFPVPRCQSDWFEVRPLRKTDGNLRLQGAHRPKLKHPLVGPVIPCKTWPWGLGPLDFHAKNTLNKKLPRNWIQLLFRSTKNPVDFLAGFCWCDGHVGHVWHWMKNAGKARNLGPKKEDLTLFGVVMDDVPFFSAGFVGRIQVEITDHEAWQENKKRKV